MKTKFTNANLSGCNVYGISAWDLEGELVEQRDLIIAPYGAPIITVSTSRKGLNMV